MSLFDILLHPVYMTNDFLLLCVCTHVGMCIQHMNGCMCIIMYMQSYLFIYRLDYVAYRVYCTQSLFTTMATSAPLKKINLLFEPALPDKMVQIHNRK